MACSRRPALRPWLLVGIASLGVACASTTGSQIPYRFFASPDPENDPWYEVVDHWQERERSQEAELPDPIALGERTPRSNQLRVKMGAWQSEERLALARHIAAWAQHESRRHYRFDPPTSQEDDPWPTTADLLETNGDDCDGLDLIAYKLMLEFGFPEDQLYRAIVRRDRDRANHMVTLWFEDPEDPWVIDSTGAVSQKVRRFSELPGWTPTKVFNQSRQYTPEPARRGALADAVH